MMRRFAGLRADVGFYRDRRILGRRHRPTFTGDDEGYIPYNNRGWQADTPIERFQRGW
jgi:hypothetical protein